MKLFVLVLVTSAAAQQVDPRGARPVVPNTRSEKCGPQKEWPMCTHAEMDSKCPSGCRIHGLMERVDHNLLKKIEKIRGVLEDNMAKHRNTDQESKKTHNALRERLTVSTGQENDFFDMAQTLRMKITEMKIKIDHQLQVLGALKEKVRDQVNDMHRLEVDIDLKLRSCKGSCKTYHTHEVDHEGHVELGKQMHQLDTLSGQTVENVATLHVMKRRPLKDAVVDNVFKSGDVHTAAQTTETTEDLFPSVNTMQLFLEVEGSSSSSPATVSKVPVCLRLTQNGRQSPPPSDRKQSHCRRKKDVPLCSDHDTETRCPSGCRLQGLMLDHEAKVENKLRNICEKSKTIEEAAEKTMSTTAEVYHRRRELIISQSAAQVEFADGARALTKNLTELRKRSQDLELKATELRENIQEQLEHLLRTEVEVGMALRSCLGSCRSGQVLPVATEDLAAPLLRTPSPRRRPAPMVRIRAALQEGLDLFEDLQTPRLQLHEEEEPDL